MKKNLLKVNMIIRYVSTNNIEEILDVVLRDLIRKNISYVVIKNLLDVEIHFDKYIKKIEISSLLVKGIDIFD